MIKEYWKNIKGLEGEYQISNLGRIRHINIIKDRIVGGYNQITIRKKDYKIHRLVAEAFIDNPNNLPQVNHKDENKQNNNVDNLEWCDARYNINYGSRTQKQIETFKNKFNKDFEFKSKLQKNAIINGRKVAKPLYQYDYDMKLIAKYEAIKDASKILSIDLKFLSQRKDTGLLCKGYYFFTSLQIQNNSYSNT